ncbi:unnamed protein product, partial [Didymodactylos carnosus]
PSTSADLPTTFVPITSMPVTSISATSAVAISVPTTSVRTTSAAATSTPATYVPTTAAAATSVPATTLPTSSVPTTSAAATSVPSTSVPSTSVPTTSVLTTSAAVTSVPTTPVPTTHVPTTSVLTTSVPTTHVPTTSVLTTSAPATSVPATSVPATSVPTTSVLTTSAAATSATAIAQSASSDTTVLSGTTPASTVTGNYAPQNTYFYAKAVLVETCRLKTMYSGGDADLSVLLAKVEIRQCATSTLTTSTVTSKCGYLGLINVTFDDLPSITLNAPLPSSAYSNLIWTNAHYIYRGCLLCPSLGYPILCTSGDYVGYFQGNQMLTIQPKSGCTTFTFISVLMIASRRNEVTLIEGYYNNTRLYNQNERSFSTFALGRNEAERRQRCY